MVTIQPSFQDQHASPLRQPLDPDSITEHCKPLNFFEVKRFSFFCGVLVLIKVLLSLDPMGYIFLAQSLSQIWLEATVATVVAHSWCSVKLEE